MSDYRVIYEQDASAALLLIYERAADPAAVTAA